jgi:hypothetical protein
MTKITIKHSIVCPTPWRHKCATCQNPITIIDESNKNFLDEKDTKKHKICPKKNIGLERPGSFRREEARRMKSKHE